MKIRIGSQRGSYLAAAPIALCMLLPLMAFVVDIAVVYVQYTALQNALDSSALAAAKRGQAAGKEIFETNRKASPFLQEDASCRIQYDASAGVWVAAGKAKSRSFFIQAARDAWEHRGEQTELEAAAAAALDSSGQPRLIARYGAK